MGKKLLAILGLLFLLLACPDPILAQTDEEKVHQRVIIYMIDKLNLSDIDPDITPQLWSMQNEGGLGLLNTLSAGERTSKNVPCTISAGKLAVGSSDADLNFKATEIVNFEKAGDIFFRNTGFLPADHNVVVSSIEVIKKNNEKRELGQPGKLGDELHAMGLKTAVIGNADLPGDFSRSGALILMDSNGIVDNGLVGREMIRKSQNFPQSSDYNKILEAFRQFQAYDVILIQFGDLARLDRVGNMYSSQQLQVERKNRLIQIDACIGKLQPELDHRGDAVYVISPTPSHDAALQGEFLTPFIIDQSGVKGVLTSYSTRREGIVSSISLKNSILHYFNPAILDTIYASPANSIIDKLKYINQRVAFEYLNQAWLVTTHAALIFLLLFLVLAARLKHIYPKTAEFLLLYAAAIPLSLLLMGNFDVFDRWLFLLISLGLSLVLSLFGLLASRVIKTSPLSLLLFLTISTIALDLVFDLGMLKHSILSYRIMSGLRYYGLGNEYMGVLIGSTIALSALVLQKTYSQHRLFMVALLFSLVVFLISYPLFGINVGGGITACIGLGYTYMRYSQHKINLTKVLWLVAGTMVLLAVMAAIDLQQPLQIQSHLGRNVNLIRDGGFDGGFSEILKIISRKAKMELRLINYSILGWVLLALVLLFSYFVFRPASIIKRVKEQLPVIYSSLQGIIVTIIIAILFNDSGITAAAVLSLYFILLYLKYLPR